MKRNLGILVILLRSISRAYIFNKEIVHNLKFVFLIILNNFSQDSLRENQNEIKIRALKSPITDSI